MSRNGSTPATKEDFAALETELLEAMQQGDARLKDELLEAIRDVETHLLKAFYGYTEGIQKHFTDLDLSNATIRDRLGNLENRLIALERRVDFPDFKP